MRRERYKDEIKCIVILSSAEMDDWDKARRKEDKQLRYINSYAKKHQLVTMEIVRRGCFGPIETSKLLDSVIKKMKSGKAEAVLVVNALAISNSVADAYLKIGKVNEAGYRFITVDEGELGMKLSIPEDREVMQDGT